MKFIKMFAFPVAFALLAVMTLRDEGVHSPWFWFEVGFAVATLFWDGGAAWLWSLVRPKPKSLPPVLTLPPKPEPPVEFNPHTPGSSPGDCTLCARIVELRKDKGSSG